MRQIGIHADENQAHRFAAWLVTEGVTAHAEPVGEGYAIWVREENLVERAKAEYEKFCAHPNEAKYVQAEYQADAILREQEKKRKQTRKNVIEMRGKWSSGGVGVGSRKQPLVWTFIGLSILVGALTGLGEGKQITGAQRMLTFRDPLARLDPNVSRVANVLLNIRRGEVWRLITPIFIHYGIMHIAFNMIMLYQLGGRVEDRIGTVWFGVLVVIIALISNAAQALAPPNWDGGPFFGGMSGVVYGVLGYMWIKTVYDPNSGIYVPQSTVVILGIWLFAGVFGVLESLGIRVANWAHGVGLIVGMAAGYAPVLLRSLGKR